MVPFGNSCYFSLATFYLTSTQAAYMVPHTQRLGFAGGAADSQFRL